MLPLKYAGNLLNSTDQKWGPTSFSHDFLISTSAFSQSSGQLLHIPPSPSIFLYSFPKYTHKGKIRVVAENSFGRAPYMQVSFLYLYMYMYIYINTYYCVPSKVIVCDIDGYINLIKKQINKWLRVFTDKDTYLSFIGHQICFLFLLLLFFPLNSWESLIAFGSTVICS